MKVIDTPTYVKWERYSRAKEAKAKWAAEEREAKQDLLAALGYSKDDPKPASERFVFNDSDATEYVVNVAVGERKGLDVPYLRRTHPDIYAECERYTYPISIKPETDK